MVMGISMGARYMAFLNENQQLLPFFIRLNQQYFTAVKI